MHHWDSSHLSRAGCRELSWKQGQTQSQEPLQYPTSSSKSLWPKGLTRLQNSTTTWKPGVQGDKPLRDSHNQPTTQQEDVPLQTANLIAREQKVLKSPRSHSSLKGTSPKSKDLSESSLKISWSPGHIEGQCHNTWVIQDTVTRAPVEPVDKRLPMSKEKQQLPKWEGTQTVRGHQAVGP